MELFTVLLTLVAASLLIYHFFFKGMSHFKKHGVRHVTPLPFLGNMGPYVFRRSTVVEYLQQLYNKFSDVKYFGFYSFMSPVIVIRDPELIHSITVKNFDHFTDHLALTNEETDPLMAKNLFSLEGDTWREMRKVLSPSFTASKMKLMFKLMRQCAENFSNFVMQESKDGKTMNLKQLFSRYTCDVVASCAFGVSVDSMREPDNEFYVFGMKAMNIDTNLSMKFFFARNFTRLTKLLNVQLFNGKVTEFFQRLVESTVKARDEHGIVRPDMIQMMMESRGKGANFSIRDMTSQAFIFFLAGFDSTATIACFMAHEIAANPDVQSKLRAEIRKVMEQTNGDPTYEAIWHMKYLDAIVNETLRLYPLTMYLDRVCVKEFELPAATPDAKPITLKPGNSIWIPNYSLHRDPKYFPEPDRFDPDRFVNGEVNSFVYMPFGIGPRICIANRFALMELKVLAFYLFNCCELKPCSKTTLPMRFDSRSFIMLPKNGFWLTFRALDDVDSTVANGNSTTAN